MRKESMACALFNAKDIGRPISEEVYEKLNAVLHEGLDTRGLMGISHENNLYRFSNSLLDFSNILIVSGFCVGPGFQGETDGPVGSIFLARAIKKLGKRVRIYTDKFSRPLFERACQSLNLQGLLVSQIEDEPDLIIAIERPGMAGGKYYNMRGLEISHLVEDTDHLIQEFMNDQIPLYAIGDGGNEVGMGKIKGYIKKHVKNGDLIAADIAADQLLISGVSNWGAYAVIASLSHICQQALVQTDEEEDIIYDALVQAGAVDGITGENEKSVDGYSMDKNMQVLRHVREALL